MRHLQTPLYCTTPTGVNLNAKYSLLNESPLFDFHYPNCRKPSKKSEKSKNVPFFDKKSIQYMISHHISKCIILRRSQLENCGALDICLQL